MMNCFSIGTSQIGDAHPCFVIAEVGQAHDGSLGTAHAYIDAAARAKVNAIKFQTHIADAESTPGEPFRVKFSKQDASRYEYWKRMEFTEAQWIELAKHAVEQGLVFLSTPFSYDAFDLLNRLNIAAWKVGSGEVNNLPFLKRMAQTKKPVLLSSGMSSWAELDQAVQTIESNDAPLGIFQCTTSYPTPPEKVGLNVISELQARYDCPVGLSDHSGTIFPALAGVTLGIQLLEVHLVFSRECFGPDVAASVTIDELTQLVNGIRFIEQAKQSPVNKDQLSEEMSELKIMFGKSLVLAKDLSVGHQLSESDFVLKKPGTGIPAAKLDSVLGKNICNDVFQNQQLKESDYS